MTADIIFDPHFPHGTPEGFKQGCHGAHCPAAIPCRDVYRRYAGDFRFARLYDSGMTLAEIVEADQEAARQALADERASRRPNTRGTKTGPSRVRRPFSADRTPNTDLQHSVFNLHKDGLTDNEIAAQIGKTRDQVRSVRKWLNLPVHRQKTIKDWVREYHAQGMNDVQIAEKIGRKTGHVSLVRRQANLPLIPVPRTEIPNDEIRRLHGEGLTDAEIAARFNTTRERIRSRRGYLNLPVNPAPPRAGLSRRKTHK